MIIPLWYDHSSKKSILTYSKESECVEGGSQSIVRLAKETKLQEVFGISNNFHTFFEAFKNLKEEKIAFRFGLSLIMCENVDDKTEDSLRTQHKVIVWMKNSKSYKDLIKIYTKCHSDINNKYYIQRFDFNQLNKLWTDNLVLSIPFFDSFVHQNALKYNANIIPDFPSEPVIFREQDSGIPFAPLINKALDVYNKNGKFKEVKCKTIYYEKREDCKPYITYRALDNRATFNSPNIDFMCSQNFCFENFKELTK